MIRRSEALSASDALPITRSSAAVALPIARATRLATAKPSNAFSAMTSASNASITATHAPSAMRTPTTSSTSTDAGPSAPRASTTTCNPGSAWTATNNARHASLATPGVEAAKMGYTSSRIRINALINARGRGTTRRRRRRSALSVFRSTA